MDQKDSIAQKQGILIVFEGIDGTGKSTQLDLLAKSLKSQGHSVITTREPTNGTYGQKIRSLYENRGDVTKEEELELFLQDRREHVRTLLEPGLAKKNIILCDRYFLSTIAYQGAAGFDIIDIAKKNYFAPKPNLAILFEMSPKVSIDRITNRRGDTLNDFEQEENLQKVAQIFDKLDFPYIRRIDANRPIESVHETIVSLVEDYLTPINGK